MTLTVTNKPLYLAMGAVFVLNMVLFAATRAVLDLSTIWDVLLFTLTFGAFFFVFARLSDKGFGGLAGRAFYSGRYFCEAMFFTTLISLNIPALNHLTMTIPFPYQDELLNAGDVALGLDWLAYFEWVHASPTVIAVMEWSYNKLSLVGLAVMALLILTQETRRVLFHMEIFFYTVIICVLIGAAFPALAAVDMYIEDIAAYTNFPNAPGVYHLPWMEMLRDPAQSPLINPVSAPGLVTFPSYHTASGILLCITAWRTWMFWPVALYSAIMIASSPIFGGHYFVDLIAGTAIALAVSAAVLRLRRYEGMFAPRRAASGKGALPQTA
ncbi:phosphatase PAP2 family protein [Roseovarius aquimarinus]|uniref:Phosphatase PAP2 family protein n=1 Tax=Roseovarius aquimarinus TaxID=1229156 RepID=A0ABW7I2T1_9RHOB